MVASAEYGRNDSKPFLRLFPLILPVSWKNPEHVMRLITCDLILHENR